MDYSLIANSGIHVTSFPMEIKTKDKFSRYFMERFDVTSGEWTLELLHEISTETGAYYYRKKELLDKGYLAPTAGEYDIQDLYDDGIKPVMVGEDMQDGNIGEVFKLGFNDRNNCLSSYENKWLPLPYFIRRNASRFEFGPLNWSRFRLVHASDGKDGAKRYDVLLAFDTRTSKERGEYNECPVFSSQYETELHFDVCQQEFYVMDFCSPQEEWKYIDEYLRQLVYPGVYNPSEIKSAHKLSYVASYFLLIDYIAQNHLFPSVTLYGDRDVVVKDVDMAVDIGNSRTTALLVEDSDFNKVGLLQLIDYTAIHSEDACIRVYQEPFDMRLALRKVSFGDFGMKDSRQFVYPSIVRLGKEANDLIHIASESDHMNEGISTLSSPKRYL